MIIPSLRHQSVPAVDSQKFQANITKRRHEDIQAIEAIEQYIIKKRGYVFRPPKQKDAVILLISGGVDSTVAWYLLSSVYHLHVYPLFVTTKKGSAQERSVAHFSRLFQDDFGDRYHAPFTVVHNFLPPEMADVCDAQKLPSETLLDLYDIKTHQLEVHTLSGLNGMSAQIGAMYSVYLKIKRGIAANTIFCAVTARDGIGIGSQTLTSLRATLLYLMRFHDLPSLQYASVFFEKETGWYAIKRDIIAIGAAAGLPLWKTYSCYKSSTRHCGECLGCLSRRYEFKKARVKDPTIYQPQRKTNIAKYLSLATIKENAKNVIKTVLFARR